MAKKTTYKSPLPFSLKFNAWILYVNLTHPTRKTTTHATSENNKGKRRPQITSNYRDFGPFAAMYPMKTWLALRYCTTPPGHNNLAKIRDRQPGCGLTICPIKALPVWRTCFTRQFTATLPPPPPRHLFFKLNAQILYLNLTHPTRKTTTHATSENNKGKRRPQNTSNYRDFGPLAAIYPMKTWLVLRYCTTRPGHNNLAKIRDRQPGCGLTICPIKALPVWRTSFTRQFTTTLPPPTTYFLNWAPKT